MDRDDEYRKIIDRDNEYRKIQQKEEREKKNHLQAELERLSSPGYIDTRAEMRADRILNTPNLDHEIAECRNGLLPDNESTRVFLKMAEKRDREALIKTFRETLQLRIDVIKKQLGERNDS